eukprot:TRINITY_DN334_c0_g3_i1.p1 TRINITY_DN334_c0_g3~~TRINITY_DN334_c0_g3_i1.p1  ORF type:complete len:439 (+),score=168.78 TRINITY_DN334_c0_g3_i1:56-1372(+)
MAIISDEAFAELVINEGFNFEAVAKACGKTIKECEDLYDRIQEERPDLCPDLSDSDYDTCREEDSPDEYDSEYDEYDSEEDADNESDIGDDEDIVSSSPVAAIKKSAKRVSFDQQNTEEQRRLKRKDLFERAFLALGGTMEEVEKGNTDADNQLRKKLERESVGELPDEAIRSNHNINENSNPETESPEALVTNNLCKFSTEISSAEELLELSIKLESQLKSSFKIKQSPLPSRSMGIQLDVPFSKDELDNMLLHGDADNNSNNNDLDENGLSYAERSMSEMSDNELSEIQSDCEKQGVDHVTLCFGSEDEVEEEDKDGQKMCNNNNNDANNSNNNTNIENNRGVSNIIIPSDSINNESTFVSFDDMMNELLQMDSKINGGNSSSLPTPPNRTTIHPPSLPSRNPSRSRFEMANEPEIDEDSSSDEDENWRKTRRMMK